MAESNYKPTTPLTPQTEVPAKAEKVIHGTVTVQKRTGFSKLRDVFAMRDIKDVCDYVVETVIGPTVRRLFYDMVTGGLSYALFSDSKPMAGSSTQSSNPYWRGVNGQAPQTTAKPKTSTSWREEVLLFANYPDAVNVYRKCLEWINSYQTLPLARFYDFCDKTCDFTYNKYGWKSLPAEPPIRPSGGGWIIEMPEVVVLDHN